MDRLIAIAGACVRPAAMSGLRAGLVPRCADRFADRDLRQVTAVERLSADDYPSNILKWLDESPSVPFCYTGALENHPDLIEQIAVQRPVWGNSADTLRGVRDPARLAKALADEGIPSPAVCMNPPANDGRSWLVKPLNGGAGIGIERWAGQPVGQGMYWQQLISGLSRSGIFAAINRRCRLLGVTRQLVGERWLHAPEWHYCGSIGPISLTESQHRQWQQIGDCLVRNFGLRGLFGVDAIENEAGIFPVEVNPRYTASVEVLELAGQFAAFDYQKAEFDGDTVPAPPGNTRCVGKAIRFAPKRLRFPTEGPWDDECNQPFDTWRVPRFADIPQAGEIIEALKPVMTFFAEGADESECEKTLRINHDDTTNTT